MDPASKGGGVHWRNQEECNLPLYDIMGKDNNDGTANIGGIKQNFGDCIITDENGNAVPGEDGKAQVKEEYKEQLAKNIAKKYGNQLTEKNERKSRL